MSYFPSDIPFMSKEEREENGIEIPKENGTTSESLCEKVRALCEESNVEFFFISGGESTWSVTSDKHIRQIVECHKAQLSQEGTTAGTTDTTDTTARTTDTTADTVSRKWLLDEYDRRHVGPPGGARKIIESASPVTPEQKKGHWLRYGQDGYLNKQDVVYWQCDQCLETYIEKQGKPMNYCPNCGAKMEGANE